MRMVRQLAPLLMALPVAAQPGPTGLPPSASTQIQIQTESTQGEEQPDLGPNVVIRQRPGFHD